MCGYLISPHLPSTRNSTDNDLKILLSDKFSAITLSFAEFLAYVWKLRDFLYSKKERLPAMTNFSQTSLSAAEDGPRYGDMYDNTSASNTSSGGSEQDFVTPEIIAVLTSCICVIGLVGNGLVIHLLGFHIKRSPFITYILNLAVADFGVLVFCLFLLSSLTDVALMGATFMYTASQLLLTAVSIDRCVSVLFPIWHRCHRPPHLTSTVCALIWALSFLLLGSLAVLNDFGYIPDRFFYSLNAAAVLCLPLVTVSTLILSFKEFCRSRQPRRGRPLTIVLLTLFFYLILAFPLNAILTLDYFTSLDYESLISYGFFCAILNSCVNPVIYYMVGRKKRDQQRQSLRVILQRAFEEEEEEQSEEQGTAAQTSL
ncbi:UNVERIFIED_CONTAM: hypothetical protein K2H54_014260 [Gekko kuhli]